MKDIETLLNKYFEGETTCEEERRLRRFFAEGLVPEHLEVYRPMFAFFEAEQKELAEISGTRPIREKDKNGQTVSDLQSQCCRCRHPATGGHLRYLPSSIPCTGQLCDH